jgi:hypothetical protein
MAACSKPFRHTMNRIFYGNLRHISQFLTGSPNVKPAVAEKQRETVRTGQFAADPGNGQSVEHSIHLQGSGLTARRKRVIPTSSPISSTSRLSCTDSLPARM